MRVIEYVTYIMISMTNLHTPVLLNQVLEILDPQVGQKYLDATAGLGGHAQAILERTQSPQEAALVDQDATAIAVLEEKFPLATVVQTDFASAAQSLLDEGRQFDLILMDLGVSSPQLDRAERGFSFRYEGPLDMRMDQTAELSADQVVNTYTQVELERILYEFGEEPRARAVAAAIVAARPLRTTQELAAVVRRAAFRPKEIDAATKTFQAIRLAVNNELDTLAQSVPLMVELLVPGGKLVIISFHSLEDRIVKLYFDRETKSCICPPKQPICTCEHQPTLEKITRKPLVADASEIAFNPRARSAKLRAVEKINKNKRRDS